MTTVNKIEDATLGVRLAKSNLCAASNEKEVSLAVLRLAKNLVSAELTQSEGCRSKKAVSKLNEIIVSGHEQLNNCLVRYKHLLGVKNQVNEIFMDI